MDKGAVMLYFATPWVLIILIIPFIIIYLLKNKSFDDALEVPFFNHLDFKTSSNVSSVVLPVIIWSLLSFALAGPRVPSIARPLFDNVYNIFLTIDLSDSMQINDMYFNGKPASRLAIVKRTATAFVKQRSYDQLGLILFGTRAYLLSPLTFDHKHILKQINEIEVGLAGKTTSLGDALGLTVKHLLNTPKKGRIIILLTDGANNSGFLTTKKAAQLAKNAEIKVYTIGLGTNTFFSADLDENALREIAKVTDGQYFRATDPNSLTTIYKKINKLETISQKINDFRPSIELYFYPLTLGLIILLFWMLEETLKDLFIRKFYEP